MRPGALVRWLLLMVVVLGFSAAGASPAVAHADFESATPPDGSVSSEPIERFELVFTAPVEPVEGSTRLLSGRSMFDVTIFQPNPETVVVEPLQPLSDGQYALFWKVQSADGHVLEGTVSVEVLAETTTTTRALDASGDQETPTTTLTVTTTSLPMVNTSLPPRAFESSQANVSSSNTGAGQWISSVGRWVTMTGALLAIGAFVFAGTSLVGTLAEVRQAVRWIRRGGLLVLIGTLVEVIGASTTLAGSLSQSMSPSALVDVLATSFGVAVLLRIAGGIALLQDPRLAATVEVPGDDPESPIAEPSGVPEGVSAGTAVVVGESRTDRYHLDMKQEWVEIAGIIAIAASFTFDGHTAAVDPTLVARLSSFIHVLAAGVWFGGLVVMADLLRRRWRSGSPLEAAATTVRFSRSAVVAVVVVALAGLALTWTIIESPSDLVSSAWGRLLLVKVSLVTLAAIMGGYNQFRVMPLLDGSSGVSAAPSQLRRIVTVEALVLACAVAVTAVLVGLTI